MVLPPVVPVGGSTGTHPCTWLGFVVRVGASLDPWVPCAAISLYSNLRQGEGTRKYRKYDDQVRQGGGVSARGEHREGRRKA